MYRAYVRVHMLHTIQTKLITAHHTITTCLLSVMEEAAAAAAAATTVARGSVLISGLYCGVVVLTTGVTRNGGIYTMK